MHIIIMLNVLHLFLCPSHSFPIEKTIFQFFLKGIKKKITLNLIKVSITENPLRFFIKFCI